VQRGQLEEEVVVEHVGREGEQVADERDDEQQLPAVDVRPGADITKLFRFYKTFPIIVRPQILEKLCSKKHT
jgi:hypothetical protein